MLPIILALAGTYLILDSKKDKFADGGETDMNDMKISSVKITNINSEDKDDDLPKVIATLEDGTELFLFEYYPDEISFTKQEFVGLTPKQAIAKKNRKEEIYSMFSNNQVDFEKGGKMDKGGYMVFNYTDDIYASNDVFKNKTEANNFIKEFRKRFENQGYYRDNRMEKVAIEDIDLLAIPKNFNPYKKMADGGSVSDDLENFDTNKLDSFEYMQFTNFTEKNKMSKKDALQILINNVEGDYSQLSPKLRAIAKKNKMADGGVFQILKSKTKQGFGKAKDFTKKQIHDQKKKVALNVIDETKDKYKGTKEKMHLKAAEELVKDKFANGGKM